MPSIFDLDDDLDAILLALSEEGASEELLQQVVDDYFGTGDMASKVDGYCALIRDMEAQAEVVRQEAARLQARAKSFEGNADRLRSTLRWVMIRRELERIKTAKNTVYLSKPVPRVHVEPWAQLPERYVVTTTRPDLQALKEALRSGEQIEGVSLVEGERPLVIK